MSNMNFDEHTADSFREDIPQDEWMQQFEHNFKEYSKQETPDLWDRIEAGLPVATPVNNIKTNVIKKSRFRWYHYAPVAAACLCLAILIPVMRNMQSKTANDMAKTETEFDYAVGTENSETADGAMPEDMWDMGFEGAGNVMPEAESESSDAKVEDVGEGSFEHTDGTTTEEAEETADDVWADEAPVEEPKQEDVNGNTESGSLKQEMTPDNGAVILTLKILSSEWDEDGQEFYYLSEIIEDDNTCYVYLKSTEIYKEGETCQLPLWLLRTTYRELPVYVADIEE